jgi:hypothetical protein
VSNEFQFDQIGYWSEIKLDILEKYAKAYSTILASRRNPSLYHVYIDAFAGAGVHLSRTDQQVIPGSPLNALKVRPPFQEYHLIDIKPKKVENLRKLIGDRRDVSIYEGDCNQILLEKVFSESQVRRLPARAVHTRSLRTRPRMECDFACRPDEDNRPFLELSSGGYESERLVARSRRSL